MIPLTVNNVRLIREELKRQHLSYSSLACMVPYTSPDVNPLHLLRAEQLIHEMFEAIQESSAERNQLKQEIEKLQHPAKAEEEK